MRLPSRFIPAREPTRLGVSGALVLLAPVVGLAYFVYSSSNQARLITATLFCAFAGYTVVMSRQEKRRFNLMAQSREGESICDFARSFDARQTDTWIIRAAYEELQSLLKCYVAAFPVRASDSLLKDLGIDEEDVEDLLNDIAERSGRSLTSTDINPYYGRVESVSDLVLFINAQPLKA